MGLRRSPGAPFGPPSACAGRLATLSRGAVTGVGQEKISPGPHLVGQQTRFIDLPIDPRIAVLSSRLCLGRPDPSRPRVIQRCREVSASSRFSGKLLPNTQLHTKPSCAGGSIAPPGAVAPICATQHAGAPELHWRTSPPPTTFVSTTYRVASLRLRIFEGAVKWRRISALAPSAPRAYLIRGAAKGWRRGGEARSTRR